MILNDSPWRQFEDLVRQILEVNGFEVSIHSPRGNEGFDLSAKHHGNLWAIEVKYYRTARAQPSLLDMAAARVVTNGAKENVTRGMLVMSCALPPELRLALEKKFSITFVDRVDLRIWCAKHPELSERLDSLLEMNFDGLDTGASELKARVVRDMAISEGPQPSVDTQGAELCRELRSISRGRNSWSQYETLCERILKYLFPNDLHGWHSQTWTDDGLNRYDYICRIKPTTEFWRFLLDHLDSRYVLFEFKNYTGPIKQGQVLTTEKYLLERGLRRVAIILTRAGADPNAVAMTQGAMRESGKLMLVVDDNKVCEMLHMKGRGEDPSDCLFEIADDFLLTLPR
jgi:hypothetical protein